MGNTPSVSIAVSPVLQVFFRLREAEGVKKG